MGFDVVGDGLRFQLEEIKGGNIPKGDFRTTRGEIADTMSKYIDALKKETPGIIPNWWPQEVINGPIESVKQYVPDNEALIGEVDRFLTAIGNLMRPGIGDTIH